MNALKYKTEISKEFTFEAAHRLTRIPADHKCARLHGHSFRVVLTVSGPIDPVSGWIVDFADLSEAFKPIHEKLDHRYLNEIEGLENPTCECLAHWILNRITIPNSEVTKITVLETCTSSCTVTKIHANDC